MGTAKSPRGSSKPWSSMWSSSLKRRGPEKRVINDGTLGRDSRFIMEILRRETRAGLSTIKFISVVDVNRDLPCIQLPLHQPGVPHDVYPQEPPAGSGHLLRQEYLSIDADTKILHELVSAIFKEDFIKTMLIPQEPLDINTLKELFRKLAHSSIMKLDNSSMDKLLYLIIMTLKK